MATMAFRRPSGLFRVLQQTLSRTRRPFSTKPDLAQETANARIGKVNSRLPKFLRKYTSALSQAPVSHITAFLVLHEITAVVPLFGLAATFHYTQWLPPYISEGKYISDYVEMFGRYFRRKGWLGESGVSGRDRWWGRGEGGVRIVVEFATAYAVTKVLLPLRLVFSVWATPWFARIAVLPVTARIGRLFGRKTQQSSTAANKGSATLPATSSPGGRIATPTAASDVRPTPQQPK